MLQGVGELAAVIMRVGDGMVPNGHQAISAHHAERIVTIKPYESYYAHNITTTRFSILIFHHIISVTWIRYEY